ncbi:OprD family outer membrane porin [Pseudomonas syringae]|uniref:OprD family outer membrane porin n=1 Tax=Pseudomonas syringae TaxID=317 RepID=UPI000AA3E206|nr:OprD family outer membrane porin [Pseudomonas syringae]
MTLRLISVSLTGVLSTLSMMAHADFVDDSHLTFSTKNFYFNRDYRDRSDPSKAEEWAQGLILKH